LTSLILCNLGPWGLDAIGRAIPPARKRGIRGLTIYQPEYPTLASIAAFISNFTELATLEFGEMYEGWKEDALADLLGTNEPLVPPPSSITKLVLCESGHLPSTVLEWFTDHHSGVIKSLSPYDLPTSHPIKFRSFMNCFGASLSDIKFSISGNDGAVKFLDSQYFATLSQLKSIVLNLYGFESLLPWFPTIIAQLPSSMEEITLVLINFEVPDQLSLHKSAAIWSQLDRTLLGAKLPSLRSLTIVCYRRREEKETLMKAMWPQLLPRFAKQRILAIKSQ